MIPDLPSLAAYGQRMHRSTCVVEVPSGDPVFDPTSGQYTTPPADTLYSGSCQATPTGGARVVEFGEGPTTLKTYDVGLDGPVDGIPVGAEVRFTSSPDPDLATATLVVLEVLKTDTVTNRRLIAEHQGG